MDVDIDDVSMRTNYGEERYEVSDFQKSVQKFFKILKDESWTIIDARKSIEDCHDELRINTLYAIEKYGNSPLNKLWCKDDNK